MQPCSVSASQPVEYWPSWTLSGFGRALGRSITDGRTLNATSVMVNLLLLGMGYKLYSSMKLRERQADQQQFMVLSPDTLEQYRFARIAPTIPEAAFELVEMFNHENALFMPHGVLIYGASGSGKTTCVRTIAAESGAHLISVAAPELVPMAVGGGVTKVRALFAQVSDMLQKGLANKVIICIEDIDMMIVRGGAYEIECRTTLNELFKYMESLSLYARQKIQIFGTTSSIGALDGSMLRSEHFDYKIQIYLPDNDVRELLLRHFCSSITNTLSDEQFELLAQKTHDWSPAQIKQLVHEATFRAIREKATALTFEHLAVQFEQMEQANVGAEHEIKARLYTPTQVKTTFADVAGNEAAKDALGDIVSFLKNPKKYLDAGAQIPRGVLLSGEPGNGKTLLARALAGEANCLFLSVTGSEFVELYVGMGASRVREMFAAARNLAPCIIFIDEIDSLAAKRSGDSLGSGREADQTLNQLLAEMDGFASNPKPVIVVAATNRPDILDPAILRPGRFDRKVMVAYPDALAREKILKIHTAGKKIAADIDLKVLAQATPGFSGADLASMVNEALIAAINAGREEATLADFNEARDTIYMGAVNKNMVRLLQELWPTAVHEAGHAMVTLLNPGTAAPLYKLTILSRGGTLGHNESFYPEERHSLTRQEYITRIMISMGGRIAEELLCGEVCEGAWGDFRNATAIARAMVCDYGMSDLGPMTYSKHELSDQMAFAVDQEVQRILRECYAAAKKQIEDNRHLLEKLATVLLEREEMGADEVYELLGIEPRTTHKIV